MQFNVAETALGPKPPHRMLFCGSIPETTGSLGTYFNRFFFNGRWDGFVMPFQTCKVAFNGVLNVGNGFFPFCAF